MISRAFIVLVEVRAHNLLERVLNPLGTRFTYFTICISTSVSYFYVKFKITVLAPNKVVVAAEKTHLECMSRMRWSKKHDNRRNH